LRRCARTRRRTDLNTSFDGAAVEAASAMEVGKYTLESREMASRWRCSPPPSPVVRKKRNPSLSSLLHKAIFVMQAAEHGSLRNPISERQPVSVLVGRDLV